MNYKREAIVALAADIKRAGFRVFIAESGTYGFFTDEPGSRVVSFQYDFSGMTFSGNYKTSEPRRTGTGWGMGTHNNASAEDYRNMFNSCAPSFAVGSATWKHTTLAQHLATYQQSSKYTEFEG